MTAPPGRGTMPRPGTPNGVPVTATTNGDTIMSATATTTSPATTATPTSPLTAIIIDRRTRAPWARARSAHNALAYAVTATGPAVAGDVWIGADGAWYAYRRDTDQTGTPGRTVAEALASVGWLETVRAGDLVDMVRAAQASGADGVRVVMSDGRHATAYAAQHLPRPAGCPVTVDPVDVTAVFDESAEVMTYPRPINADAIASTPWKLRDTDGTMRPAVRLILPGSAPVALVPEA